MPIDIGLLQVLQAIASEASVTAAANRLGLSQSTVSHALKRLRAHYGDSLFVSTGRQLTRTPLAQRLVGEVERLLIDLERVQGLSASFEPAVSRRHFRVHMLDVAEALILPGLLRRLAEAGSGLTLEVVRASGSEAWGELESGRLDLVVGTPWKAYPSLYRRKLFDEQMVGIARTGHPLARQLGTLDGYLRCEHCCVTPRGPALGRIEAALAALAPNRRVALQLPDYLVVPALVAQSDLVAAVPSTLLSVHPWRDGLQAFALPIAPSRFAVFQYWHRRAHEDGAVVWLREQLLEALPASLRRRAQAARLVATPAAPETNPAAASTAAP